MFKTCFKVLCLLAPAVIMAQEELAAAADQQIVDAAAQPVEAQAGEMLAEGQTIEDVHQEVDWSGLQQLVGDRCTQNLTMHEFLANSSLPYYIPQDYRPFVEELGLDFAGMETLNATTDLLAWNATDLRQLFDFYIMYHNAVAERLGANATMEGEEQLNMYEGFNTSRIHEQMIAEEVWPAENATDLASILQHFHPQGLAYEIFSFYNLFFGQFGLFKQQQEQAMPIEQQAPIEGEEAVVAQPAEGEVVAAEGEVAAAEGAEDATQAQEEEQAAEGFLQEQANAETQVPAEGEAIAPVEGETVAPIEGEAQQVEGGQALDANFVFRDIDKRIKEFAFELACSINYELNQQQQEPVEGADAAILPTEEIAPVEGEAALVEGEAAVDQAAPAEGTAEVPAEGTAEVPADAAAAEGGQ